MPALTAVEKILARKSGKAAVRPGDVVSPDPDFIMIHDGVVMGAKRELDALGINRLATPDKVVMVTDHDVIYGSARAAERGAFNRKAAAQWGVKNFFDVGRGGHGHIFPMETGMLLPGMFYFDNDRHATNAGAIGAFGFRMGSEISRVLATGTNWVMVPKTVRLTLKGRLQPGVHARDVGFHFAAMLKQGGLAADLDYRVLEYAGDLEQFDLASRAALCSTPTEIRAYGVFVPPSDAILAHAKAHAKHPFTPVYSDPDARYDADLTLDISRLEPQVSLPGSVENAVDISKVAGTAIDHAFIGSCGSGMWEDMTAAAAILKDRRLAPGVRLFIAPGSEATNRRLATEGLLQVFIDAGAVMLPPGCGPCNDAVIGPVHSGEASISTATNNNAGRFGAKEAKLYLGSPATVAASAVAGKITDARKL
ncbi:MAG: aconitase family protein [Betaproteobacteria bacterium]|jgi:3-isopropylmalate/(R)-2-methylmalate dehydratase large subunit|nr:aconitase family protein [Betaproteobacteria bacterium]MDH5343224.1 aconitase family protein [Betaproteobacteria bacterium]